MIYINVVSVDKTAIYHVGKKVRPLLLNHPKPDYECIKNA